jgi:hypothetical protein
MVQHLHGGAASSARRSNAKVVARVCAVVVKESRVWGWSWGHFKGGAGGLDVRVIEGAGEIPGETLGWTHARRKERDGSDTRARASKEGRAA